MLARVILGLLLSVTVLRAEWGLAPDPAKTTSDWKPSERLDLTCAFPADQVRFADQFGPFAMVDVPNRTERLRRVYDLRTGAYVGDTPKVDFLVKSALDPTGQRVAAVEIKQRNTLLLFDVAKTKELARVQLPREPWALRFLSDEHVLVVSHVPSPSYFVLIDVSKGTIVRSWESKEQIGQQPAVSMGGRYVAGGFLRLSVFDVTTGQLAANIALPLGWFCRGAAFSIDGQRLGAILEKGNEQRLMVWSLADGRAESFNLTFPKAKLAPLTTTLQATLDGGWFVDESSVLDAQGKLLKSIPMPGPAPTPRRAVRTTTIIGARPIQGKTELSVGLLGHQPVNANDRPVTDPPIIGAIPTVKTPKLDNIEPLPTPKDPSWKGPLDAHAGLPARASFNVPMQGKVSERLFVSRHGTRAVIECMVGARQLVDLTHGSITLTTWPFGSNLIGDSVDGTAWLATDSKGRLDCYDETGQLRVSWNTGDSNILYAAALPKDRALSVASSGQITLWQIPACVAIWTMKVPMVRFATLSPNGQFVIIAAPDRLIVLESETGAVHGVLRTEPIGISLGKFGPKVAVRPDGKELALWLPGTNESRVYRWDLTTGQAKPPITCSPLGSYCTYMGHDHLLVGTSIYDLRRPSLTCQAATFPAPHYAEQPPADGRLWYAAGTTTTLDRTIVSAYFPAKDANDSVAAIAELPNLLLKPNDRVKIVLNLEDAPRGVASDAQQKAEAAVRMLGFVPADDGAVTLRLSARRQPTGKTVRITDSRGITGKIVRPLNENVTVYDVITHSQLERDGNVFWSSTPSTHSMGVDRLSMTITIPDDNMTATEFFGRKVWDPAVISLTNPYMLNVTHVARVNGETRTLPLKATATLNGLTIQWPQGFTPQERDPVANNVGIALPDAPLNSPGDAEPRSFGWLLYAVGGLVCSLIAIIAFVGLFIWLKAPRR